MPNELVLLRHGESEGNVASRLAKTGDLSSYTDSFVTTPGHRWRLTSRGREQAHTVGGWIRRELPAFDRHMVSPYVRAKETAAELDLPEVRWLLSRAVRERDWGDIGSMPRQRFEGDYPQNARMRRTDPLYWVPPGGESIAHVAEDRVRNALATLHRECSGQRVLMVTHGELMLAFRLVLERWSDEEFLDHSEAAQEKITNCTVLHYSPTNPTKGDVMPTLGFLRSARPVEVNGTWQVQVSGWQLLPSVELTNDDLRESFARVDSPENDDT